MTSSILSEFASEVAQAPSYSSVYSNVGKGAAPSPVKSPIVSNSYSLPSSLSSDNISSLSGVENFFSPLNTSQNYSSVYSSVGQGASRNTIAQNLAETPAVSDTAFGFANSLFEGQLNPEASSTIISKQSNPSQFLSDTLSFLAPRVTTSGEQNLIANEVIGNSNPGTPGNGAGLPSDSASNAPNGNYVTPDSISQSQNSPQDPATQQQQQQQQQQPQQPQGGGVLGGGGGSTVGNAASGILSGLEAFISAHPIAALAIGFGALLILGGGLGGGKRR